MILVYTINKYRGSIIPYPIRRMFTMFCFHKKKKKKNTALIIIGIVIGVAAAAVGGYFLFTKFLKDKLCKKNCECAEECGDCEETADDVCEACAEVTEEIVEE